MREGDRVRQSGDEVGTWKKTEWGRGCTQETNGSTKQSVWISRASRMVLQSRMVKQKEHFSITVFQEDVPADICTSVKYLQMQRMDLECLLVLYQLKQRRARSSDGTHVFRGWVIGRPPGRVFGSLSKQFGALPTALYKHWGLDPMRRKNSFSRRLLRGCQLEHRYSTTVRVKKCTWLNSWSTQQRL